MLSQVSALHAIAAQRGDGLRPELLRLLDEHRRQAETRSVLSDSDTLPAGTEFRGERCHLSSIDALVAPAERAQQK
jgi:hypothetical protein